MKFIFILHILLYFLIKFIFCKNEYVTSEKNQINSESNKNDNLDNIDEAELEAKKKEFNVISENSEDTYFEDTSELIYYDDNLDNLISEGFLENDENVKKLTKKLTNFLGELIEDATSKNENFLEIVDNKLYDTESFDFPLKYILNDNKKETFNQNIGIMEFSCPICGDYFNVDECNYSIPEHKYIEKLICSKNNKSDLFNKNSSLFFHYLDKKKFNPIKVKNLSFCPDVNKIRQKSSTIENEQNKKTDKSMKNQALLSLNNHFEETEIHKLKKYLLYFKEVSNKLTTHNKNIEENYDLYKYIKILKYIEHLRFICVTNTCAKCFFNLVHALDFIIHNSLLQYRKSYFTLRNISINVIKEMEKLTKILAKLKDKNSYSNKYKYYKKYISIEASAKNMILLSINNYQKILEKEFLKLPKKSLKLTEEKSNN
ncbi:hypothetical protein PGAL8A_00509000 [Plasmodium gallinaceum]|uniref:C2H2-type domain-containing protein n=1 Tax=Plasmodium gallinaceum TaxID=5849 RepID=A0A1J1GYH1_PLAGA|nr:hypothetical protein PGAL8A_00509000 [Plasmodium gallinaceum]CRG97517.1 hypothetical protein PGAL8A_00509000 [Plasmodium gallinaceum]